MPQFFGMTSRGGCLRLCGSSSQWPFVLQGRKNWKNIPDNVTVVVVTPLNFVCFVYLVVAVFWFRPKAGLWPSVSSVVKKTVVAPFLKNYQDFF